MKALEAQKLINYFKLIGVFSRQDLRNYFVRSEGEIKEGTLGWRIYDLKKKSILREIKKGLYTLNAKPVFIPQVDDTIIKLAEIFTTNYRNVNYCLWNIDWLNEFTVHQLNRNNVIFETEKDLIESVGPVLSDNGYTALMKNLRAFLISFTSPITPIILQPLITRAPTQNIESEPGVYISVPTLEKILVDVYVNENVFQFVHGAEMENIFRYAMDRYAINYTTFFGYAKRRGKEGNLQAFISKHFPEELKNITK